MKKPIRPRRPGETRSSPMKPLLVVLGVGVFVVMCFGWLMSQTTQTRTTESVKAQPIFENALPLETLAVLDTLNDRSRLIVDAKIIAVPRVVGTPSLRAVEEYIVQRIKESGPEWRVEIDEFVSETPVGKREFRNIIATWIPTTATTPLNEVKRIILAAHYDSKVIAEFDAACDSAIPCVILLDLVRTLSRSLRSSSLNQTIQLVFFDGEEAFLEWTATDSLYGSRHLAAQWEKADAQGMKEIGVGLKSISAFVLLDLLGTKDMGSGVVPDNKRPIIPLFSKATRHLYSRMQSIEMALSDHGLRRVKGNNRNHYFQAVDSNRILGRVEDDHIPFLTKGVPILHMITVPFPSVWHTTKDTLSNIDWDVVEDLSLITRAFVFQYLHLSHSN